MKTALAIIEEVYEMALNPNEDYFAQLEPLAASGELANRISANKVLFQLCMLVDTQSKRIKELEENVGNLNKAPEEQPSLTDTPPIVSDPTEPI